MNGFAIKSLILFSNHYNFILFGKSNARLVEMSAYFDGYIFNTSGVVLSWYCVDVTKKSCFPLAFIAVAMDSVYLTFK